MLPGNPDISILSLNFPILLFAKSIILLFILLYVLFTLIALVNIRALDKLVVIKTSEASRTIQLLFFVYFLLVIGLFLAGLVIL